MRKRITDTSNYTGRHPTITTDPDTMTLVNDFLDTLEADISPLTRETYRRVAIQVLNARQRSHKLSITSKAKWGQVHAVVTRMKSEGILTDSDKIYGLPATYRSKKNTKHNMQEKVITLAEFNELLTSLPDTDRGRELALLCELAYFFGLRLTEALQLTPDDCLTEVTAKGTVWYLRVRSETAKGAKARNVPVIKQYHEDRCMDVITRFTRPFTITRGYVQYEVKKAVRTLDGPETKLSFHSLRHSFGTFAPVGVRVKQILLGHAHIATTLLYDHSSALDVQMLAQMGY